MAINEKNLERIIHDHVARINALTAVVGGLLVHVHKTEGDEGLAAVQVRAETLARQMSRPMSPAPDKSLIHQLFESAKSH